MQIIFILVLMFSTTTGGIYASTEKIAHALERMELILTKENKKTSVPVLAWISLKNFEEKLYYTTAHDPAGLVTADVPEELRSYKLTGELMSDWYKLSSEADFYGINDSVQEWSSLKKIFLTIVDQRNQYLFNQSRKPLKSGQLKKSIEDLGRYWSRKWYQENPRFTVSYDLQQMNELKALVTASRVEVIKSLRSPASEASKYDFSSFIAALLLILSSTSFYVLGKKLSISKLKNIDGTPTPIKDFISDDFDYGAWIKDFSVAVEAFNHKQEVSNVNLGKFSDVSNQLRELRVGIMLSTTEDEYLILTQRLIDTGLKLEGLLDQKSAFGNCEVFEHLVKTVVRLCIEIEKNKNTDTEIAA